MSEPVYCEDCDLVHTETRKLTPDRWLCTAKKRPEPRQFVTRTLRLTPPYWRCRIINTDGACPHWTARRESKDARS